MISLAMKRKIESLKAEIAALEREAREEIPAQMESARAVGPVRENADMYLVANRATYVGGRLEALREQLRELLALSRARSPGSEAGYGSTLDLLDLDTGLRRTMRLVSFDEVCEDGESCSLQSPMGRAFAGRRAGEEVEVRTPSGAHLYRIERVARPAGRDEGM